MKIHDFLHKARTVAASIPAWIIRCARDAAQVLSGIMMLTAGSISMANDYVWLGAALAAIGVITIDTARALAVERARYEAFKEGVLSLLNNNGATIKVTHYNEGATHKGGAK